MFKLNDKTKQSIFNVTGLHVEQIANMTCDEQREWIEKRANRKIVFSKEPKSLIVGRGNPLLSRRRFKTLEDLDQESKELFGI